MISMRFDWHKDSLLEHMYFTESMPLLTPSHRFMTYGGLKAFTPTANLEKCGEKTYSGGQLHHEDPFGAPLPRTIKIL